MSEIRKDIISGNSVIISVERGKRPHDFIIPREEKKTGECPFCPGHEQETPPELAAWRENGSERDKPGWQVRVVPNKYAALSPDERLEKEQDGIFSYLTGKGTAEVVIESPEHERSLGEKSEEEILKLLTIIQQRHQVLTATEDIQYVQVFKNYGSIAGASLEHPHWQIMAMPLLPNILVREFSGAAHYYQREGSCPYCAMVKYELERGVRVVTQNEGFISLCPYASRFPLENWLIPRDHQSNFALLAGDNLKQLARILKRVISRYEQGFHSPYNLVVHSSGVGNQQQDYYHWHIEILPRLAITAGFELGTGIYINPTPPEMAAQILREGLRE